MKATEGRTRTTVIKRSDESEGNSYSYFETILPDCVY